MHHRITCNKINQARFTLNFVKICQKIEINNRKLQFGPQTKATNRHFSTHACYRASVQKTLLLHRRNGACTSCSVDVLQVYLIERLASQRRVVVRSAVGRLYSIPVTYPLKFKVVGQGTQRGNEAATSAYCSKCCFFIAPHLTYSYSSSSAV